MIESVAAGNADYVEDGGFLKPGTATAGRRDCMTWRYRKARTATAGAQSRLLAIGGCGCDGGGYRMHLRCKVVGEEIAVPEELRLECGHRATIQLGVVGVRVWRVIDPDHGRRESGASDHRNTAEQQHGVCMLRERKEIRRR